MADTVKQLRTEAKARGILGYSRMSRQELEKALSRLFPVSRYGDCDVSSLRDNFVHISGKRLQPTCKRLGIECSPALVGWRKVRGYYLPVHDGVVVRSEDADRLRAALRERVAKDTPDSRAKRQAARERAHERNLEQVAADIRRRFPTMPEGRETQIARYAWEIGSGRVGRSRSADDPVRAAVVAHIRHHCTDYDELLRDYGGADDAWGMAREAVADRIDQVLREWGEVDLL